MGSHTEFDELLFFADSLLEGEQPTAGDATLPGAVLQHHGSSSQGNGEHHVKAGGGPPNRVSDVPDAGSDETTTKTRKFPSKLRSKLEQFKPRNNEEQHKFYFSSRTSSAL